MDKTPTLFEKFGQALFDQICEWIGENTEPDHIYSVDTLKTWARDNGFVSVDVPETGPGREL